MDCDLINRRLVIGGLLASITASPVLAQHTDHTKSDHASGGGRGRGGAGGGQHGRPADRHSGEDGHTDDHADDHGDDHASGGKGRGGPKYRGGRTTALRGFGRGRSLEDRVLKLPAF